ncbi:MAG: double zinc ribbon domain-containing protein [Pyrinomonadaceae bacterium]
MKLLTSIADQALDAALALAYPQLCAVCGRSVESRHDGVACSQCWNEAPLFEGEETLCSKCGALSVGKANSDRGQIVRCGRCDDSCFTSARACGLYEGALRASVLELKRQPHAARRLIFLMCAAQRREPLNHAALIIPVPLHKDREQERGFNQASILARELFRLTGLPVDEHSVVRRVHTERHRAGMDAKARRQSVAHAFTVRHPKAVAGKRVLLVDDVFTTGATASACAGALKEAGASEVFVLTVARA